MWRSGSASGPVHDAVTDVLKFSVAAAAITVTHDVAFGARCTTYGKSLSRPDAG